MAFSRSHWILVMRAAKSTRETGPGSSWTFSGTTRSTTCICGHRIFTVPGKSYRQSFCAPSRWTTVYLPFSEFVPHRTERPLNTARLRRIGLVAIGREFEADVSIADIRFYAAAGEDEACLIGGLNRSVSLLACIGKSSVLPFENGSPCR